MIRKFQALEGVQGLQKIIALSRANGAVIYSSKFKGADSVAKYMQALMHRIGKLPDAVTHLAVNLISGRILVYLIREHMLVLHVDSTFDVNELRSRIKDAATRMRERVAPTVNILERLEGMPVESPHLMVLSETMAVLSRQAVRELGVFVSVNALKEVREGLLDKYRVLYSFLVNKDGSITFRVAPSSNVVEAVMGVTTWGLTFFNRCNDIVPTFPPELALSLLEPLRPKLAQLGFYQAWQMVKDSLFKTV